MKTLQRIGKSLLVAIATMVILFIVGVTLVIAISAYLSETLVLLIFLIIWFIAHEVLFGDHGEI